jgi:hypothetical protein
VSHLCRTRHPNWIYIPLNKSGHALCSIIYRSIFFYMYNAQTPTSCEVMIEIVSKKAKPTLSLKIHNILVRITQAHGRLRAFECIRQKRRDRHGPHSTRYR